jgi:hypothetical protein
MLVLNCADSMDNPNDEKISAASSYFSRAARFSFSPLSTFPRLFSVPATSGRYTPARSPPVSGESRALPRTYRVRLLLVQLRKHDPEVVQRQGHMGPVQPGSLSASLRQISSASSNFSRAARFSFSSLSTFPSCSAYRPNRAGTPPARSPPVCGKFRTFLRTSRPRPACRSDPPAQSRRCSASSPHRAGARPARSPPVCGESPALPRTSRARPASIRLRNPLRLHQIKSLARLVSEFSGQPHCSLTWPPESRRRERGF